MRLLVDTDVLIDAVTQSPRAANARRVLDAAQTVIAPASARVEFMAVLTKEARVGNLACALVERGCAEAFAYLDVVAHGEPWESVVSVSRRYGCSGYDAMFLHSAQALSLPLVTSDYRLSRAAPSLTVSLEGVIAGLPPTP